MARHMCVMYVIVCGSITYHSLLSFSGDWVMQGSVRWLAQYPLGVVWSGHIRGALCGPPLRLLFPCTRTLFSETGVWEKVYQPEIRRRVEEWWHPRIMTRWRETVEEVRGPFSFQSFLVSDKAEPRDQILYNQSPRKKILITSMCTKLQSIAVAATQPF